MAVLEPNGQNSALEAELATLRAENAKLKADKAKAIPFGLKISEKGALSVYGLGRFPVTLYGEQWDKLDAMMAQIMDYRRRNAASLKTKAPA